MSEVIVECSFPGVSGLPKDQFVNVFNFNTSGALTADFLATVAFKVIDFWITAGSTGTALAVLLSPNISPRQGKLKLYDRSAAIPRAPIASATFTIPAASSGGALPEQIALCLSYFTDRNIKSHRGRIYVGPLAVAALNTSNARPFANTLLKLKDAAVRLATDGVPAAAAAVLASIGASTGISTTPEAAGVRWALYSPTLGTSVAINAGWIDDEWDGQSRRRVEATSRTVWP